MTVKEMCEKYPIVFQTVYKKIERHQDVLAGHIIKRGKQPIDLDDFAVQFLLPRSEYNKQLEEKVAKALNEVRETNAKLKEKDNALAKANSEIFALKKQVENADGQIKSIRSMCRDMENESGQNLDKMLEWQDKAKELEQKLADKNAAYDKLAEEYEKKCKSHIKQQDEILNMRNELNEKIAENERLKAENEELKAPKKIFGRK